ncbi:MAG: DUF6084 family protein [Egibacteraceae bacterium]
MRMTDLVFDCLDVQPERYAAAPALSFRLKIAETTGATIHTIALRCQLRIDVQRRRYTPEEAERLSDLFGEVSRWGETLKPMHFTTVSLMVQGFSGSTEVDMQVPLTYDFEVATAKYFHGLDEGEIPLVLMFSGTVYSKRDDAFAIELVPWHKEAAYRLPVPVWRETMDLYFPNSGWIRIRRDLLDRLRRYRSKHAPTSWDETIASLLKTAGEDEEGS